MEWCESPSRNPINNPKFTRQQGMNLHLTGFWVYARLGCMDFYLFSGTPSVFNITDIGQNLEKPNWKRFRPTKAVKKSQYFEWKTGLTSTPKARLSKMKKPAITWTQSLIIIFFSSYLRIKMFKLAARSSCLCQIDKNQNGCLYHGNWREDVKKRGEEKN